MGGKIHVLAALPTRKCQLNRKLLATHSWSRHSDKENNFCPYRLYNPCRLSLSQSPFWIICFSSYPQFQILWKANYCGIRDGKWGRTERNPLVCPFYSLRMDNTQKITVFLAILPFQHRNFVLNDRIVMWLLVFWTTDVHLIDILLMSCFSYRISTLNWKVIFDKNFFIVPFRNSII